MPTSTINLGSVNIGDGKNQSTPTSKDIPFHLLILGNFSAETESHHPLKPIEIDRDNFEDVFERFSPSLNLSNERLMFKELEHFEPDYLYGSLKLFSELRSLKRRLSNTDTFPTAAEEINKWTNQNSTTVTENQPINPGTEDIQQPGNLLDSLLDTTENRQQSTNQISPNNIAERIIKDIIAPYISPATNPKQPEYIKITDSAIANEMSQILHSDKFQSLESLWRGIYFLVRRLTTDSKLKIFIADISQQQLANDLDQDSILSTELYRNIIEPYNSANSTTPWSLILGHYQFKETVNDIQLLKTLSSYAAECDASFVSEIPSTFFGCEDINKTPDYEDWTYSLEPEVLSTWNDLRSSYQSQHLAFGFPRFLLRLPYGSKSNTVESFDYEEMPSPNHYHYLWSNGGLAITYILAVSYSEHQWQFKPGQVNEITNLPIHIYADEHGDKESYPCAEVLLTERAAEKIIAAGITPCWSIRNTDEVRVGPFISANANPQTIKGRWLA